MRFIPLISILALLLSACAGPPAPVEIAPLVPTATAGPDLGTPTLRPTAPDSSPTATPVPSVAPLMPTPTPGGPLARLAGWGGGIPIDAAYLPDGQSIAVLRPSALELRPAGRLAELRWRVSLPRIPSALAITPDGTMIAVGAAAGVDLYAAADGTSLGAIPGLGAAISDLASSPDGRLIALAQADQVVSLWDVAERSLLSELRLPISDDGFLVPGALTSVAFSPDGQYVAAGDDGGNVGVWALSDGVAIQTLSVGLRVVSDVAFAPDSRAIAAASQGWRSEPGSIWIWDVGSGAELHWLGSADETRFLAPAERLAFSPDGAQVLMGLADGSLLRWRLSDASPAQELHGHSAAISALAFTGTGAILSASRDGSLRTWHADGTPSETLADTGAITTMAISPDGGLIISGDEGGRIEIHRRDGTPVAQVAGQGGAISALALAPDGASLASASADGLIRLWGVPGGEPRGELRGTDGPTLALAFSRDGAHLASGGYDGSLRLWRVASAAVERATPVLQTDGISNTSLYQVAFSPDGQVIAVAGSEGALSLWRSSDLTQIERRATPNANPGDQVAFSPSGALVARTYGGQLYIWSGPGGGAPILSPDVEGFALLGDEGMATLSGGGFHVWRGPLASLVPYADAPTPGFSRIVASPTTIALGSGLGMVEVWSLR